MDKMKALMAALQSAAMKSKALPDDDDDKAVPIGAKVSVIKAVPDDDEPDLMSLLGGDHDDDEPDMMSMMGSDEPDHGVPPELHGAIISHLAENDPEYLDKIIESLT